MHPKNVVSHVVPMHGLCAKDLHQLVEILQLSFVGKSTFFPGFISVKEASSWIFDTKPHFIAVINTPVLRFISGLRDSVATTEF